jgi:hypothetical protein
VVISHGERGILRRKCSSRSHAKSYAPFFIRLGHFAPSQKAGGDE